MDTIDKLKLISAVRQSLAERELVKKYLGWLEVTGGEKNYHVNWGYGKDGKELTPPEGLAALFEAEALAEAAGVIVKCDGCARPLAVSVDDDESYPTFDAQAKWITLSLCPDCARRWQAWRLVWVDENGFPVTHLNDVSGELVRAEEM